MIPTIRRMAEERFWRLELKRRACPSLVETAIRLDNWVVSVGLAPDAESRLASVGIHTEQQRTMARGLLLHEFGHWEVCPFDSEGEYRITENVGVVVRRNHRKAKPKEVERKVRLLSNMVADVLVDTVLAIEDPTSRYANAQALFFLKELSISGALTKLYLVFMLLNLELWGSRSTHVARIYSKLPLRTDPPQVREALGLFPLDRGPGFLAAWLRNKSHWPRLSRKLARLFLGLLPKGTPSKGWWRPSPFRRTLTVLYEGRTAPVGLGLRSEVANAGHTTVTPLLTGPVDPLSSPAVDRLCWHRVDCLPRRGERPALRFHQVEASVRTPTGQGSSERSLPDLAFLLDSSGSMGYEPYEGRGLYDLLLRTVFGVFHWLRTKGLASYLRYAVLNFSETTRYSGWCDWAQRDRLYDVLFDYQGGKTVLGADVLRRAAAESQRPFAAIMVTDGELEQHEKSLECIAGCFRPPDGLVLVQLNTDSRFARRLREMGFRVHLLKSRQGLEKLVLGEISGKYSV